MKVWYKDNQGNIDCIDTCRKSEAEEYLYNYRQSYGCHPGQWRYGTIKIWAGLKRDEPADIESMRQANHRSPFG